MRNISVILPLYNEVECIDITWKNLLDFSYHHPDFHFIFVDDGSTDKSKEVLTKNLENTKLSYIKFISYDKNRGKGYAVKKGLEYAYGDFICYIDSDLAYSLEHLELIVEKLEYFDMVIGSRSLVSQNIKVLSLSRKVAGKTFNYLSRYILDLPFKDMQAGIKGFKKDVAEELFKRQLVTSFSFDVELIYLAKKEGYQIGEIPAIVSETHLYKSSKVNLFKNSLEMFLDLLTIKYNDFMGKYE
ncbi:glycosyltransferase [Fischerella sp. JS2]|uniref:glycosyltransferase n=1 Tax=Fischerella sp. JS2 TaxID=2597771 RepID=UPI0028EB6A40|nr:glycosyltransferase [Fischerella sp. JS2]